MGMPSITKSAFPVPKLRVTSRSWTPRRPQETHWGLDDIDCEDKKPARVARLDDRFSDKSVKRLATNDDFDFSCVAISLSFDNVAREKDVFEVEDREVVIV
jgi:hypothetical protein